MTDGPEHENFLGAYKAGLYFVGWLLLPDFFKHVSNPKKITLECTVEAFEKAFPNDPFSSTLVNVRGDVQLGELEDIRNILAHRVVPGRIRHLSVVIGGDPAQPPVQRPDTWKILSLLNIKA